MAMKLMKKMLTVLAASAMVVATVPTVPVYAANVIITYDFENGTNMTSTGFGTDPTVVSDAERGNVLQFADGTTSEYVSGTEGSNTELGQSNTAITTGSPSSLSFANPFCGKSLTGAAVSMWVKVPAGASATAPGLVGFVSSDVTREHPDKTTYPDEPEKQKLLASTGPYAVGITASSSTSMDIDTLPMVYMSGLQHNWFSLLDESSTFASTTDTWVHMIVSFGDAINDTCVYINGVKLESTNDAGKRFNLGEINGGTPGNTTEPTLMEILTMAKMSTAYVGYTGFSPTVAGVCIDDLTFYDGAISESEAQSLFASAQSSSSSASTTTSSTSSTSSTSGDESSSTSSTSGDESSSTSTTSTSSSSTGTTTGGTTSSGTTSSSSKTSSSSTSSTATSNLPQTGVVSTGLLVAGGAAAVAAGAILFKKKEKTEE